MIIFLVLLTILIYVLDLASRAIVHGDLKPQNILIGSDHMFNHILLFSSVTNSTPYLSYVFYFDCTG